MTLQAEEMSELHSSLPSAVPRSQQEHLKQNIDGAVLRFRQECLQISDRLAAEVYGHHTEINAIRRNLHSQEDFQRTELQLRKEVAHNVRAAYSEEVKRREKTYKVLEAAAVVDRRRLAVEEHLIHDLRSRIKASEMASKVEEQNLGSATTPDPALQSFEAAQALLDNIRRLLGPK